VEADRERFRVGHHKEVHGEMGDELVREFDAGNMARVVVYLVFVVATDVFFFKMRYACTEQTAYARGFEFYSAMVCAVSVPEACSQN
jgi:hypothetical protein